jgi:GNAT superfamily N-acetyltransferase
MPDETLFPFDPSYAGQVSGWARTAAEVAAWCSRTHAPVPPEVIAGWGMRADISAHALVTDGGIGGDLVAYGELWVDDDEREVELARLIVDPDRRGQGIGRALVAALVERARLSYPTITLRVLPDKHPRCAATRRRASCVPAPPTRTNGTGANRSGTPG